MQKLKEEVSLVLSPLVSLEATVVEALLEIPPDPEFGDLAFPCFSLAKTLKKAPPLIAKDLASGRARWSISQLFHIS